MNNEINNHKIKIAIKFKHGRSSSEALNSKINNYFNNAEHYFDRNDDVIIGKDVYSDDRKDKFNRLSHVGNKESYKMGKDLQQQIRKFSIASTKNIMKFSKMVTNFGYTDGTPKAVNKNKRDTNFEPIDDLHLTRIYDKARERIHTSADNKVDHLETFPDIIQDKLNRQEKLINKFNVTEMRNKELNEYLSAKVGKDTCETLMNKSDTFKLKKQLNNLIGFKEPAETKFGENSWIYTLRHSKNKKFRNTYFNSCTKNNANPLYATVNIKHQSDQLIVNRPYTISNKDYDKLVNNKYLKSKCNDLRININTLKKIDNLEIVGKNLLEEEIKQSKSLGKKILYTIENQNLSKPEIILEEFDPQQKLVHTHENFFTHYV